MSFTKYAWTQLFIFLFNIFSGVNVFNIYVFYGFINDMDTIPIIWLEEHLHFHGGKWFISISSSHALFGYIWGALS
jgi:hypothetical protein